MSHPANYLLITEAKIEPKAIATYLRVWQETNSTPTKSLYLQEDDNSFLEITAIDNLAEIDNIIVSPQQRSLESEIEKYLLSDWRRHVLALKEVVKPQASIVPNAPYLQLRHIEVPLSVYKEYLAWRAQTIFAHVKKQADIDSFLAYHSLLSAEPGVMFLSSFSCAIDSYLECFKVPEYQEIIKQAGNKYICGGEKGLYTKIYRNLAI